MKATKFLNEGSKEDYNIEYKSRAVGRVKWFNN